MCNNAQGYYGFDHTRIHYQNGDRVRNDKNGHIGVIYNIIPTPAGWVYTIKYDLPIPGRLQGGYDQFMADELRPE